MIEAQITFLKVGWRCSFIRHHIQDWVGVTNDDQAIAHTRLHRHDLAQQRSSLARRGDSDRVMARFDLAVVGGGVVVERLRRDRGHIAPNLLPIHPDIHRREGRRLAHHDQAGARLAIGGVVHWLQPFVRGEALVGDFVAVGHLRQVEVVGGDHQAIGGN